MTEDTKIEPALTAEEWVKSLNAVSGEWSTPIEDRAVYWLEGGGDYRDGPGGAAHGAAALCLYGQPFGFSWEDVDNLQTLVLNIRTEYKAGADWLTSIADRIEALLPPRETNAD